MGKYSKSGYKKKSEDRENPYNLINSNHITMKNVDFPVLGIDNLGNTKIMQPGAHYIFPGNEVFEVPLKNSNRQIAQEGIEVVGREGVKYNNPGVDDSHSTHVMAHEFVEGVGWVAFPTLFQVPTEEGGMEWVDLTKEKWIQEGNVESEWNWGHAYEMAKKLGEVYEFGYGDEALKQAEEFAKDGYKNKQHGGSLSKDPYPLLTYKGSDVNREQFNKITEGLGDAEKELLYNTWVNAGQPNLNYQDPKKTATYMDPTAAFRLPWGPAGTINAGDARGFVEELKHANQFRGDLRDDNTINRDFNLTNILSGPLHPLQNIKRSGFDVLSIPANVLSQVKGIPFQASRSILGSFNPVTNWIGKNIHNPYEHHGIEGVHNVAGSHGYAWGQGLETARTRARVKDQEAYLETLYQEIDSLIHEVNPNNKMDIEEWLYRDDIYIPQSQKHKYEKIHNLIDKYNHEMGSLGHIPTRYNYKLQDNNLIIESYHGDDLIDTTSKPWKESAVSKLYNTIFETDAISEMNKYQDPEFWKKYGGSLPKAQEGGDLPYLRVLPNGAFDKAYYDPHPLRNEIVISESELRDGKTLPHEMYHWRQRDRGDLFENSYVQTHPVGPVSEETLYHHYNRRKYDLERQTQQEFNYFPESKMVPNFTKNIVAERNMYFNPNTAEGEAKAFESVYQNFPEYLKNERQLLLNKLADNTEYLKKQDGGSLPKAQKGNEVLADIQVQSMLQEAGYDTQLSDLRGYQGGYDDYSFANFAKAIGIYDNLYENPSRLNQFVRNIWPAIQFAFRQRAMLDPNQVIYGKSNWKSPWETDFVSWDEARPLLNEEYDIQNLVLDLTAIVFPAADVAHGFEQIGRGNYVNGALFMLFGIIPGTAGPLVDAIAPKLGALSDMAKGSPKTFRQNEEARKLAREIEKAIKEADKTGIKIDPNFTGPNINPATVGKVLNIDDLSSMQPLKNPTDPTLTSVQPKIIKTNNPNNKDFWYQTDESGNLLDKQKRFVKNPDLKSSWAPSGSVKINGELVNFEDFLTTANNKLQDKANRDGIIHKMHYKNYVDNLNISNAEKRNLMLKVNQHFADEPYKRQVSIFMDNNKEFGRLKEVARTSKNNPGELFVNKQQLKSYIVGDASIVPPASSNPYDQALVNKAQTRTQEQKDYLLNLFEQNYGNLGKYDAISLNEFQDLANANMVDLKNFSYPSHRYADYGVNKLGLPRVTADGTPRYEPKVISIYSDDLTKASNLDGESFFGGAGSFHQLNENSLGHFRILDDADNPHVLNVLEQQSDWKTKKFDNAKIKINSKHKNDLIALFQDTIYEGKNTKGVFKDHFPKNNYDFNNPAHKEKFIEIINSTNKPDVFKKILSDKLDKIHLQYDDSIKNLNEAISGPVSGQGALIGKNYDRYGFQQALRYALDNNKSVIRYPSVETSIKIQGHRADLPTNIDEYIKTNPRPDPNRPFNQYIDMDDHSHNINTVTNNIFSTETITIPSGMPGAGARMINPVISKKANNELMDYGSMYGFKYNQTSRQRQLNANRYWEIEITGERGYNSGVVDIDVPHSTTSTHSSAIIDGNRSILSKNVMKKELTEKGYKKYKKIIDKEYNGNVEAFILDKSDEIRKANLDKYYRKLNNSPKKKARREESIIASMHNYLDESYFINPIDPKGMNKVNLNTISSGEMSDAYKKLKKGKTDYPIDFKLISYDNLSDKGKEAYARYANYYDNIWFNEPVNPGNWSLGPERQGHQVLSNSKGQVIGSVPFTGGSDSKIHKAARKWQMEAQNQTIKDFDELFQINLYDLDDAGNLTYIDPKDYKNYQETLHKKNVELNAQKYELDLDKRIKEAENWDKNLKTARKQLNRGDAPLAISGDTNYGVHTTYQKSSFEKMVKESLGEDYVQYITQYTDEAGNTWHQLDLPEDVLSGKTQIRGMQQGGEISEEDLNKFKNNAENNPAWLNNRLRTSVTPMNFKNASEEMVYGKRRQDDEWDNLDEDSKNIYTDSWLKYLGYEQKNQTFKTSNYKKNDDDKDYVQFSNEDAIYNIAMSDEESDLEFDRHFDSKAGLPYISYSKSYNPNLPLIEDDVGRPYEIYGRMYYDPSTKDSEGSPIRISDDMVSLYAIRPDDMKAGIQHVESNDGEKEYDENDSKTGRYGQLFDDVKNKYKGSKEDFSKDEKAQDDTFNARYNGTFSDEKGLEQSGYDLYQSNKDVADQLGYTPKELAALSYLLGEDGAQRYLSNKLTGEKTEQQLFPELYGERLKNTALLPADYVESFKEGVKQYRQMQWDYILNLVTQYGEQDPEVQEVLDRFGGGNIQEEEKKGGEITKEKRKNNRLQQQLKEYKKGNSISPIAKRELKAMGLI